MKKEIRFLFLASLILLSFFSFTLFVHAADAAPAPGTEGLPQDDATLQTVQAGQQQYDQYTTAENKSAYLAQQWTLLIGRAQYIGPINNFFLANQWFFKVFFNYQYEISFTFFFVLFIWIIFVLQLSKIFKSTGLLKANFSLPAGLLFTIVLAQINLFNFVARGITNFMFSQDAWWARLIIFILVCSLIIALSILSNYLSKYFKTQKEKERLAKLEQSANKFESFEKGVEEGQKLVD